MYTCTRHRTRNAANCRRYEARKSGARLATMARRACRLPPRLPQDCRVRACRARRRAHRISPLLNSRKAGASCSLSVVGIAHRAHCAWCALPARGAHCAWCALRVVRIHCASCAMRTMRNAQCALRVVRIARAHCAWCALRMVRIARGAHCASCASIAHPCVETPLDMDKHICGGVAARFNKMRHNLGSRM